MNVSDVRLDHEDVIHAGIGNLAAPSRLTVTCTMVPRGPFSILATLSVCSFGEESSPTADFPLTDSITSPGRRPALNAGEPGIGATTNVTSLPILPGRDWMLIPTPK